MFSLDFIQELPRIGISQREAEQWTNERLIELEAIATNAFWELSLEVESEPVLWNKIGKLMERYKTPNEKSFIAKVRRFIRKSYS